MINSSSIYPQPTNQPHPPKKTKKTKTKTYIFTGIKQDIKCWIKLLILIFYHYFVLYNIAFFTWMIQLMISGSNFHVTCFCVPLNTFFLFWHFWNTFIITTFLTINNCDKSCTEGSITINIPYYLISCAWKAWSPVF